MPIYKFTDNYSKDWEQILVINGEFKAIEELLHKYRNEHDDYDWDGWLECLGKNGYVISFVEVDYTMSF